MIQEYFPIPVLHICGLLTAAAVLLALLLDVLRRIPGTPVLAYCFVAALALWFAGTVGVDTTLLYLRLGRLPPPRVFLLLGPNGLRSFAVVRVVGYLLPLIPLAIATRHQDREAWVSRFFMLAALSALGWIVGHHFDQLGPRYIPRDFIDLLGYNAGWMAWRVIQGTALTGLGWATLAFWSVWFAGVFRERANPETPSVTMTLTSAAS